MLLRGLAAPAATLAILATAAALLQNDPLLRSRNLGKAYYEQGDYDASVRELEAVLAFERAQARDYLNAALAYMQNGQEDRALAAFTTARQMDPRMVEVDFGLGILYKRQGRFPLALQHLERVAERDPSDPATWFNMGVVRFSLQQMEAAESAFQRVLAMGYPRAQNFYVSALFREATLLARRSRTEEAQRLFERFRELRDQTPNVALTPSALENGRYGTVTVPPPLDSEPAPASATPQFELAREIRVRTSPCDPSDGGPSALNLGDVDGDGLTDLFVSSPCGENRLLRNVSDRLFQDVTADAGLQGSRGGYFATFADYDNSGLPSLLVLSTEGVHLYRNRGGRFQDVTGEATLADLVASRESTALFFDVDNDGLLDLFLSGVRARDAGGGFGLRLYRNNGNRTFEDRTLEAGLSPYRELAPRGAAFADLAQDGFADVVVLADDDEALWLQNDGSGILRGTTLPLARAKGRARMVVEDLDHDGWLDLMVLDPGRVIVLQNRAGRLAALPPAAAMEGDGFKVALDADGDGWLDALLRQGAGGVHWLANRGRGRFEAVPLSLEVPPSDVLAADLDAHGSTDLLALGEDTVLRIYRLSPSKGRWLRVALEGTRTNRAAVGAVIETKAGAFYQKALHTGQPLTFYVGERRALDVVRITWANGVIQNEVQVATNQVLRITESERQTSSCPFLYVWNGDRFHFLSDVVGRAPLGERLPDGSEVTPHPLDDVRIPPGRLRPRDGHYVFQLTEELREVAYLDAAVLRIVDHPANAELYTNERFSGPPFERFRLYLVRDRRPPVRATSDRGEDVLDKLRAVDGTYPASYTPSPLAGWAEEHTLVLEPPSTSAEPRWLLLTGWVYWPSSSNMKALATHPEVTPQPPELQVRDAQGHWVTVIPDLGLPSGINRTLIADLEGKFLSSDKAVRIVTRFRVHWDAASFVYETAEGPTRTHTLAPSEADLHYRGFSALVRDPDRRQPEFFDYSRLVDPPWNPAPGWYTRYGDVRPLLEAADDRQVVMAPGDELTVAFDGRDLPPTPPGWARSFVLHLTGWAKDHDPNTLHFRTAGPLPYHGMERYADADGSDDATREHRGYLTRRAPPLIAPLAPPHTFRDGTQ